MILLTSRAFNDPDQLFFIIEKRRSRLIIKKGEKQFDKCFINKEQIVIYKSKNCFKVSKHMQNKSALIFTYSKKQKSNLKTTKYNQLILVINMKSWHKFSFF